MLPLDDRSGQGRALALMLVNRVDAWSLDAGERGERTPGFRRLSSVAVGASGATAAMAKATISFDFMDHSRGLKVQGFWQGSFPDAEQQGDSV